ncbi:MAG: D-tyrosyl-tRNA(Tyr) deacylase [Chloroflexi bacterium]|nr:MAG: D-tyrosyl-tRNA(Tyr) deacylase [Chloroflexota bacterium]
MRVVLQRVSRAAVAADGEIVASIGRGLLVLVGIAPGDTQDEAGRLARKCVQMRIFSDDAGRFNLSLLDVAGEALVVSQFTLLADTRRGRRPNFTGAATPETAEPLVETFAAEIRNSGIQVQTGRFGAKMAVELVNDGPVTIVVDSEEMERPRRN